MLYLQILQHVHVCIHVRVGADLANLINQAALHGSATGNVAVTIDDIDYARDKIIMGPERKSAVIEEKNRRLVAYHEGGHAIVALFTPGKFCCSTQTHQHTDMCLLWVSFV